MSIMGLVPETRRRLPQDADRRGVSNSLLRGSQSQLFSSAAPSSVEVYSSTSIYEVFRNQYCASHKAADKNAEVARAWLDVGRKFSGTLGAVRQASDHLSTMLYSSTLVWLL
jgi:hypothetical protein